LTDDPVRVYVIRHGRTALNAEGRFRGRLNPPLDLEGRREAEAAARHVLVDPPRNVYSSPLDRARETAEYISLASHAPISVCEDLIDLDYGRWTGLTPEEAGQRDPEIFGFYRREPVLAIPPGGEPLSAVADRMLKAVHRIGETEPGKPSAAVSHEIPIRLMIARMAGLRGPDMWDLLLPTGSVVRVEITDGRLRLAWPRPVLVSRRWKDVQALGEPDVGP
jgi:broad specificity phosphatase PhoE